MCKFKVEVHIFTKKWSKTGYKLDNFYDIQKPVRIPLNNLITKFQVDWMKVVWVTLPADLKNMVLRKKRSPDFEKKKNYQQIFFYTLRYVQ